MLFECSGARLIGVRHTGDESASIGVVVVVGGPQYRVGSHRQFVLMARRLAKGGYPVFRYDYRGMGDAEGDARTFEDVHADIEAAIDVFMHSELNLKGVVLLGLCDAASAILMYVPRDERVAALILMNPWVRTPEGEAKAYMRHYYLQRLRQKSFWRKLATGKLEVRKSLTDLWSSARRALWQDTSAKDRRPRKGPRKGDFIEQMLEGISAFSGRVLIAISGKDLTAHEFLDHCSQNRRWRRAVDSPLVQVAHFDHADHTFSRRDDLERLSDTCLAFLGEGVSNGSLARKAR